MTVREVAQMGEEHIEYLPGCDGAPLLGCCSKLLAELDSDLVQGLDMLATSMANERRIAPIEGQICRCAMAQWMRRWPMLSPTSTFRDRDVLARRDHHMTHGPSAAHVP